MKNKSTTSSSNPIANVIVRYNLVIFIVIVVVGLIAAILTLNLILRLPFNPANITPINGAIVFDETTMNRIDKLKTSSENTVNQTLPTTRINPFSE